MQRVKVWDLFDGHKMFQGSLPQELWNGLFLYANSLKKKLRNKWYSSYSSREYVTYSTQFQQHSLLSLWAEEVICKP